MPVIDNLVAYFRLDEASGNAVNAYDGAHPLTETNGPIASVAGKVATARDIEIDTSQYFTAASYAAIQFGDTDFSFCCWIKRESVLGQRMALLTKDIDTPGSNRDWQLSLQSDETPRIAIVLDAGNGDVSWSSPLTDTASFHFIAAGHSATSNLVWIVVDNGTVVTNATTGPAASGTSSPLRLGATAFAGFEDFFDGVIDEVGLWGRDIRADLAWLYNSGNGRSYADILAEAGLGGGPTLDESAYSVLEPQTNPLTISQW